MVSRSGTDPPRVSAQRVMGRRSASARTAASWSRSRSRRGVVLYWSRKASAQASGSCRSSTGQVSERCSPRLRSRLLDFAYRADAAFSPPQLLRARRDSPGRLRRRSRIHGERHSERKPAGALQSREGGSRAFARASAAPASFRQCARPDRELARADVLPMHRMPRAQPSGALAHRPRQSSRQRGLGTPAPARQRELRSCPRIVLLGPIVADPVPDTVSRRGCDPGGSIGTARVQLPLKPGVLQASQRLWATLIGFLVRISLIATGQRSCLRSRRPRTTSDLLLRHRFRRCRR
jgi:hypothetical protein